MLGAATPKCLFTCVITFPIYVTNALEKKTYICLTSRSFQSIYNPFFR